MDKLLDANRPQRQDEPKSADTPQLSRKSSFSRCSHTPRKKVPGNKRPIGDSKDWKNTPIYLKQHEGYSMKEAIEAAIPEPALAKVVQGVEGGLASILSQAFDQTEAEYQFELLSKRKDIPGEELAEVYERSLRTLKL